ncbi:LysM peptidoglycan-binding domain-containing protein, partial [Aquimarina agarivorans]|uniref:LysM peptidoglycan-binding domain-containing protein n=1 Tax=Aquimarina agarivorans TaxID=980584 RepID=UPI000248E5B9
MPTVRFKGEYSHITFTSPDLKIFRPKINKAYFATAKIEEVTTTSTTETVQETYVVANGDTLSKIATKKSTTVDAIIESDDKLTEANKDKLKVGQKILT